MSFEVFPESSCEVFRDMRLEVYGVEGYEDLELVWLERIVLVAFACCLT